MLSSGSLIHLRHSDTFDTVETTIDATWIGLGARSYLVSLRAQQRAQVQNPKA